MLRRFLTFAAAVMLCACLCACDNVKVTYKQEPFTAHVAFQSAGTEIKGELTYNSPEDISLEIKEPDNIAGLEFHSVAKSMNVRVGEVSFSPDTDKDSPVGMLFALLKTISENDIRISLSGEDEIILQHEGKEMRVKIDCEEKKIISIETENYRYKFE